MTYDWKTVSTLANRFAPALALAVLVVATPVRSETTATQTADAQATPSDWLSNDEWQSLSDDQRRERRRRSQLSRYLDEGTTTGRIQDLDKYLAIYAQSIVYDPRHYRFDIKAEPVDGTTNSITLTGDAYPANYAAGIQELLEDLGFQVTENTIRMLPDLGEGQPAYGIATTSVATLRSQPHRRSEQVNSVARGGWIRVLREGLDSDVSSRQSTPSRRAPGADQLSEEKPGDWILAQTMEGYIGFARKADFAMRGDYRLPDGLLKTPVPPTNDINTTLPAGTFVYGAPETGWQLFDGEPVPRTAQVTDLRPSFSADEIEELMKPFMGTPYVWGGVTDVGIDCSGFSQFFLRAAGVMIPRDAVQQANVGFIVGWGRQVVESARPGDLIFFARENGRISHVAISLGGSRLIHSSGRDVHLADLNKVRREGSEETYADSVLFARRIAVGK